MTGATLPRSLRIVVPVLNEGATLAARLRALQPLRARGVELVVVDGGSTDTTWALARSAADRVLLAPRGRASQMNAGAHGCSADALLFLHADTRLPADADQRVLHALQLRLWGRFDVQIEGQHALLPWVARLMNLRSRLTGIATGDQALFVRRSVFEAMGGFAAQPLMEDVELSGRLRALGWPACLGDKVITSGRRWDAQGAWRTVSLMWGLRAAYFLGVSAEWLAERYGYAPAPAVPVFSVAVLAKAPVAGLAKTRLGPLLGAAGAARAQRRFTRHTVDVAHAAAPGRVTLWHAPQQPHRLFRALARLQGVGLQAQAQGDLGARMAAAFAAHFARRPGQPLLLLGTDCPVLAPGHLQQAAAALATHDVVLIPAEDGGYVLVGQRTEVPQMFEGIAWSTPAVLTQTRERLQRAGVRWAELPTLWDVDEPADWQRLRALEDPHD